LSSVGSGPRSWGFCAWAGAAAMPPATMVMAATTAVLAAMRESHDRARDVSGGFSETERRPFRGVLVRTLSFLRLCERGSAWKTRTGGPSGDRESPGATCASL